jgi:hypothetical protein
MIEETSPPPRLVLVLEIQAFTSLVIMIHRRRWRLVVVVVIVVMTTRYAEHRHTRQNKTSELLLDRHP